MSNYPQIEPCLNEFERSLNELWIKVLGAIRVCLTMWKLKYTNGSYISLKASNKKDIGTLSVSSWMQLSYFSGARAPQCLLDVKVKVKSAKKIEKTEVCQICQRSWKKSGQSCLIFQIFANIESQLLNIDERFFINILFFKVIR